MSLPSDASPWNDIFGRVEGQNITITRVDLNQILYWFGTIGDDYIDEGHFVVENINVDIDQMSVERKEE